MTEHQQYFNPIEYDTVQYSQDASVFRQAITRMNAEQSFAADLNLSRFVDAFSGTDVPPMVLLDGFLHLKEEQLGGRMGNAVNFFTTVSRKLIDEKVFLQTNDVVLRSSSSEYVRQGVGESLDNILATVAEYPLAEVAKKEQRILAWTDQYDDLESENGFSVARIMQNALQTSQKRDFEYDRYLANDDNFNRLRAARKRGDTRTFVEFSPSPEITPDAVSRGYLGNSCVFFYEYDPQTRKETVTQRWLRADMDAFEEMIRDGLGFDIAESADDATIMYASNFIDEPQMRLVESFIDTNNGKITDNYYSLYEYKDTDLRKFLTKKLYASLIAGAQKLLDGESIEDDMTQLIDVLTYGQFRLRNKIASISGLRTSSRLALGEESVQVLSEIQIQRLDTNQEAFALFMDQNRERMQLVGCGVNEDQKDILGGSGAYGTFGGMTANVFGGGNQELFMKAEDDPNLCRCPKSPKPHFHCPGKTDTCDHAINVGEGISQCPSCGEGKKC